MSRGAIAVVVAAAGVAAGILSLSIARTGPEYSFAGASAAGSVALLGTGWALIAAGLVSVVVRRGALIGVLLTLAGFTWLLLEWNNPETGSELAFALGTVLYAACPAVVAHAVLAFPGGRIRSPMERAVVPITYGACVLLLGLLPAFVFDPAPACGDCPRNLLLIARSPSGYADLNRVGLWVASISVFAAAALVVVRLVRSSAARRTDWMILGPGAVYLVLAAATFAASLDRGFLWNGSLERRLWRAEAIALVAVVAGVGWGWVRATRRRTAVARLVVELAQSPPPGGLREALSEIVADETLELAYPLDDSDRLVNAEGRAVALSAGKDQTRLVGGGRTLAVLAHAPGVLDDDQLIDEVTRTARLALENERLQAEVRAKLDELRRSRARIVEAGDGERRRLERDLHDGAQQRLAGLALSLRLLRSRLPADADEALVSELAAAEADLQAAIAGLRELAHGIFPSELADRGLAAAVVALAESSTVPIRVVGVSPDRYAPEVENAAYVVVAETAAAASGGLVVHAERGAASLVLEVEAGALTDHFDLAELEDRVGAADGRLLVTRSNGRTRIRAEFPCVS